MARLTMKNDSSQPRETQAREPVEIFVDRIVEREVLVDRIIEVPVEVVKEVLVQDNTNLDNILNRLEALENKPCESKEITNIIEKPCTCERYDDKLLRRDMERLQAHISALEAMNDAMARGHELIVRKMAYKASNAQLLWFFGLGLVISAFISLTIRWM